MCTVYISRMHGALRCDLRLWQLRHCGDTKKRKDLNLGMVSLRVGGAYLQRLIQEDFQYFAGPFRLTRQRSQAHFRRLGAALAYRAADLSTAPIIGEETKCCGFTRVHKKQSTTYLGRASGRIPAGTPYHTPPGLLEPTAAKIIKTRAEWQHNIIYRAVPANNHRRLTEQLSSHTQFLAATVTWGRPSSLKSNKSA